MRNGFRPHMDHLRETLERRQQAARAGDETAAYARYQRQVAVARAEGMDNAGILQELEFEAKRIENDTREGDHLFQQGVKNAKKACLSAIQRIIREIKGEV